MFTSPGGGQVVRVEWNLLPNGHIVPELHECTLSSKRSIFYVIVTTLQGEYYFS